MAPASAVAFAAAIMRAPFALFWGPTCVVRSTVESFFWGPTPFAEPRSGSKPLHVYRIACEPPCYGCRAGRCCRD